MSPTPLPFVDTDRPADSARVLRHGWARRRLRRWRIALVGLVGLSLVGVGQAPIADAAQGDGVVQPGDRFGNNYCSVGPSFDRFVFTPKHCGWLASLGDAAATDGAASPLDANEPGADWRFSLLSNPPQSVSTWTDCPSIRTETDAPIVVGGCQQSGPELAFAGVLQPWFGLRISKSGATTGTTSGTAANSPDGDDPRTEGTVFIDDMYVCKGDSGSVAYAELNGAVYLVGMVTGGSGSLAVDQPLTTYSDNEKACYRTVDDDNFAEMITIGHLCRQLPTPADVACATEAGTVHGEIEVRSDGGNGVVVSGIGFDPDTAGAGPVQRVEVTVDGEPILFYRSVRPESEGFGLSTEQRWGVAASTSGLGDGAHDICAVFRNDINTAGEDLGSCRPLPICHGQPADHTVMGTPNADNFVATLGRDLIIGGGGNDTVSGLTEEDCFFEGTPDQVRARNTPTGYVNGVNPADRCTITSTATRSGGPPSIATALLAASQSLGAVAARRGRGC